MFSYVLCLLYWLLCLLTNIVTNQKTGNETQNPNIQRTCDIWKGCAGASDGTPRSDRGRRKPGLVAILEARGGPIGPCAFGMCHPSRLTVRTHRPVIKFLGLKVRMSTKSKTSFSNQLSGLCLDGRFGKIFSSLRVASLRARFLRVAAKAPPGTAGCST